MSEAGSHAVTSACGNADATTKATVLLPEALLAILFLFAGWLVAVLVHHIVLWILGFFAIDKLAAKTPLSAFLKNLGIRKTAGEILGLLVFWLIIFFTLVIAADTLHLTQVSYALALIAHFIPQVIAAVLIIIVGMLVAKFLQILTVQALGHVNVAYKKSIGGAVQTVVLIFVFVAALDQIGFELDYVTGSHHLFLHPISRHRVTVAFHSKDMPKGTLRAILKQAGLAAGDL